MKVIASTVGSSADSTNSPATGLNDKIATDRCDRGTQQLQHFTWNPAQRIDRQLRRLQPGHHLGLGQPMRFQRSRRPSQPRPVIQTQPQASPLGRGQRQIADREVQPDHNRQPDQSDPQLARVALRRGDLVEQPLQQPHLCRRHESVAQTQHRRRREPAGRASARIADRTPRRARSHQQRTTKRQNF